jgi:hypothetical protein
VTKESDADIMDENEVQTELEGEAETQYKT